MFQTQRKAYFDRYCPIALSMGCAKLPATQESLFLFSHQQWIFKKIYTLKCQAYEKRLEQYKKSPILLTQTPKLLTFHHSFCVCARSLSLSTILSLHLWRASCRHNIPSSPNIAICVSHTALTLLHLLHPTLQETSFGTNTPSDSQTTFQSTVPSRLLFSSGIRSPRIYPAFNSNVSSVPLLSLSF